MQDDFADGCPMPETFRSRIGLTAFLGWLFYLGFVSRMIFAPLMPEIRSDLDINYGQAGSLFLMISVGYLIAPTCSGFITSKIKHWGGLNVSAWLIGIVLTIFAFIESLWAVRVLLILIGFSAGLHLPSAVATITAEIRKEDWGKALSIHQLAPPLSFVTAPLIATGLMHWFSWRMVLVVWSGAALISALSFTLGGRGGDFKGQMPKPENVKIVMSKSSFWIMVLLLAMAMSGNAGIYSMLPLFLTTERALDLGTANTLIGLSQATGLLMVIVAGILADKVGQKRTIGFALLCAGLATVLLGLLKGPWLILVLFLQPMLLNSFFPSAFGVLSRVAPPYLRSVTNAFGPPMAFLIGGGIMPSIIGYLGEVYAFSAGIVLAGCFILIGPLLVLLLKVGQYDDQAGC